MLTGAWFVHQPARIDALDASLVKLADARNRAERPSSALAGVPGVAGSAEILPGVSAISSRRLVEFHALRRKGPNRLLI
ncbi:MAG: hypothetical protein ACE5G3_08145 [Gammaproteobacteria bacterium]